MDFRISTLICTGLVIFCFSCRGQQSFGSGQLALTQIIPLHNLSGRIDHMDVNQKQQLLYVAALGNNSVEVVDLKNNRTVHRIKDLDEPQGIAYIPQTNEIFVANGGNGNCVFFDANGFQRKSSIDLSSDADDVRYDSASERIYVGYGDGGIAVIDALNRQKMATIRLPAHPEGFQLDKQLNKLFVNVPDAGEIEVIDLENLSIANRWKTNYSANFPMVIDEKTQVVFVGYRHPAKLVAINAITGQKISETGLVGDTDDLFFDEYSNRLYASGGGGYLNVFGFSNNVFTKISGIPVRSGARTSLLIPSIHVFVLAERANGNQEAKLDIFSVNR